MLSCGASASCWFVILKTISHKDPNGMKSIWEFPKIGIPQNGWFIMEIPIKIDDLGVPLFLETPIHTYYPP